MEPQGVQRKLAAILAADVAGYSRLMGENEEATLATLKSHREIIDGLIAGHQGRVFGGAGDSVIAEFASPIKAVRCATEIQLEIHRRNAELPEERRMRFRVGVNLGDVMVDGDNLFGDGVNVAARLEALARPGGLCISDTITSHIRDRLGLEFEDLGQHQVKNIAHPVQVYRVPLASEFLETSPFRGLDVFEYEHADIFHGRAQAIKVTRERLQEQADRGTAFLLICGMSGSGKSSLMRAGLLPAITRPGSVAGVRRFCVFRPSEGPDPTAALVQALLGEHGLPELVQVSDGSSNVQGLFRDSDRAVTAVDAALRLAARAEAAGAMRLALGVDQLEELFTNAEIIADERAAFVALLGALARSGFVWVVATIRTDLLHHCASVPGLSELKDGLGNYELLPPTGPEIAQMIRNPARTAGLRFEEDPSEGRLEDVLQQAAATDPASLPLLEFVLDALYQNGKEQRLLTFADYRALGGLEGAIAKRADDVLGSLPAAVQATLPALVRALTTVRLRDQAVTARTAPHAEVAATPNQAKLVDAMLGSRLLVSDQGDGGESVYRVAHEALLSHWPRAQKLVTANRELLEIRALVEDEARRWVTENRNRDLLLPPGKRAAEAEELLRGHRSELDSDVVEYLETSVASVRGAERVRIRRAQIVAAVMSAFAILAGIGGYVGFRGQEQAQQQAAQARSAEQRAERQAKVALEARDQALINQSLYLSDLSTRQTAAGNSTAGILLALEGLPKDIDAPERPYVVEAETALYRALAAQREVGILRGHDAPVNHVAFSPDGRRIVTASDDGTARLWDVSGGMVTILSGHEGAVLRAGFSADGSRILTVSRDRTARLWRTSDGTQLDVVHGAEKAALSPDGSRMVTVYRSSARLWNTADSSEVAVLRGHDEILSAAFSPNGDLIATGSPGDVRLWNGKTGENIAVLHGHEGAGGVHYIAFSPDGRSMVTASADRTARLWDVRTSAEVAVLRGHDDEVRKAMFSSDGLHVVTASLDHTARIWDARSGAPLATLLGHQGAVSHAEFSPDGERVVTTSDDGTVRLWRVANGRMISILHGADAAMKYATFSSDGRHVFSASRDGTVRISLAGDSGAVVLQSDLARRGGLLPRGAVRGTAVFSPEGSKVITAWGDRVAFLWDAANDAEVKVLRGHEGPVWHAEFSPDGAKLVTASSDGTARLWDTMSGAELAVLSGGRGHTYAAFGSDGRIIVTSSSAGEVKVWDSASGEQLLSWRGHSSAVHKVVISPDGSQIITLSDDDTAKLWNAADGLEIAVLRGHRSDVWDADFSSDGSQIVTASWDDTARVWDAETGSEVLVLEGHESDCESAVFSPDGRFIVTASLDHTARVWEAKTGQVIRVLRGHTQPVRKAVFSPNGRHVVTVSDDRSARLWEVASGSQILVLDHDSEVRGASFSADGRRLVTVSSTGTSQIADVYPTTQDLVEYARTTVPRELTLCERKRFFLPVEGEVGDCPN